jgi:hypothetical protein
MRLTKNVTLGPKRTATLRELRVGDVQNVFAQLQDIQTITIAELATTRLHDVVGLIGDCVECPPGETIEDLTFSEVAQLYQAFMELNAPFLRLFPVNELLNLSPTNPLPVMPSSTDSAASTPPPPPSSSEDTPA